MQCIYLQLVAHERRLSTSASRTMAAMSLGFIVMVTPWTIQEVVAACTGSKPPPFLDFLATWLALSNSFWNPFLYWLLNNHFRRISRELLYTKVSVIALRTHSNFLFFFFVVRILNNITVEKSLLLFFKRIQLSSTYICIYIFAFT